MKSLTESLNTQINEAKIEIDTIDIPNSGSMNKGFMGYDDNSGTVTVFQFNKSADLAKEYSTEEDYWEELDKLKVNDTTTIEDGVYTRIW